MTGLAGLAVGVIILVDIATGQGPPILNNYLAQGPQIEYRQPIPLQPIGYVPRGEYDEKILEKEGYKEEKDVKYEKGYVSTPAPGVLSSFSSSMSDAWKSLTNIGRQKRSPSEESSTEKTQDVEQPITSQGSDKPRSDEDLDELATLKPKGRSFDDLEFRQTYKKGYIYFKVPKSLICY